ncbi:DUF3139 domain-containing protein [Bacillus cereus]|uniref:DUF3139 domain-containing protein n=1 Tax=Bacillus cereus TaxID=1396 RepID=UPI00356FD08B
MEMRRKKRLGGVILAGLIIVTLGLYSWYGNPINYKKIENDTYHYLQTNKGYKKENIKRIIGSYTPLYNTGYYAHVVFTDEPYFTYVYQYDNNKKIIQENGILGRHTELFENKNLNWGLFDQLTTGIHKNLANRGLKEEKDYSIRHVQFIDVDNDKNGAEAFVDFKNDKESHYVYRINNEGVAYQHSCEYGNCSFKE